MWIDGRPVESDAAIIVHDPGRDRPVGEVPNGTVADIDRAVAVAARAAAEPPPPAYERATWLYAAAERVERDRERFATLVASEGIKTIREARKEAGRAAETLRLSAEAARSLAGETVPFDASPGGVGRFGWWTPAPVGVVGCITPFNDPLNLVAHKVGPGLAAGNAVVVKPDSKTPLSALALVETLLECGVPGDRLQAVTGDGATVGDALVRDRRVRMLSFTGGRATGERIAAAAGLKKLSMELGSNAPALVLDDADPDTALRATLSGAFWAAGQNCLHVQRILVHRSRYEAFVRDFVAGAERIRTGDKLDEATDMGPLIDEGAAERVLATVRDAVAAGATVATGGTRDGAFVAPTVVTDVPDGAELAREEIYGPVTLIRPFDDDAEAIRVANDVDYGLQAGLFTRDLDRAIRLASALHYGGVMINDSSDFRVDLMPFGGFKGSGLGREGVPFTVREMTEPKLVCVAPAGTA